MGRGGSQTLTPSPPEANDMDGNEWFIISWKKNKSINSLIIHNYQGLTLSLAALLSLRHSALTARLTSPAHLVSTAGGRRAGHVTGGDGEGEGRRGEG